MRTPEPAPAARGGATIVWRFAIVVAGIYLALLIAQPSHGRWPGLGRLHAHGLAALAQTLFDAKQLRVEVLPPSRVEGFGGAGWVGGAGGHDIRLSAPGKWSAHTSSLLAGYGSLAMAVALIAASPVPARRRILAVIAASAALHLLMFVRVGLQVRFGLVRAGGLEAGESAAAVGGAAMPTVEQHLGYLVYDASVAYGAAVVLWLATTFRPSDAARLFGERNVAEPPSTR